MKAALEEVNVETAEYLELQFAEGWKFEPVDSSRLAIDVELTFSVSSTRCRSRNST